MSAQATTLVDLGRPSDQSRQYLYYGTLAVMGSLLLAVSAQIQIPFYPIPQTLQTLVVLLIGAAYGSRLAAATVALYILEGAVGLPVFAGAKAWLSGPTVGYLIGFVIAAFVVGHFAERGWTRHPVKLFAAMLAGAVILYIPGLAWLATFTGLEKAIAVGLFPFLLGDLLKTALAALAVPAAWLLAERR